MKLAITGGTGFVGSHVIDAALAAGHDVAALTRREQPELERLRWVRGSLDDREALGRLVTEVDAIVHVAGVINAPDAAGFEKATLPELWQCSPPPPPGAKRFVHVSSLAAREPSSRSTEPRRPPPRIWCARPVWTGRSSAPRPSTGQATEKLLLCSKWRARTDLFAAYGQALAAPR